MSTWIKKLKGLLVEARDVRPDTCLDSSGTSFIKTPLIFYGLNFLLSTVELCLILPPYFVDIKPI